MLLKVIKAIDYDENDCQFPCLHFSPLKFERDNLCCVTLSMGFCLFVCLFKTQFLAYVTCLLMETLENPSKGTEATAS